MRSLEELQILWGFWLVLPEVTQNVAQTLPLELSKKAPSKEMKKPVKEIDFSCQSNNVESI